MSKRRADVVEIVMLAADTHTFLRRCCTLEAAPFLTEEDIFELVHTGVGKEQRRVIGRNQ